MALPSPLAADDAGHRVAQLTLLTERLTALIAAQAASFEKRRPQDAAVDMDETSRLANLYRHESARVQREPRLIESAPQALREKLVRATEAFDAVLARHGRALEAAKTVTEGLVKAIAEEVMSQRTAGGAYGPGAAPVGVKGNATAITLNKRA